MELLLKGTTAYKIVSGDRRQNRLSHAYLLLFPDAVYLRKAAILFACQIYGGGEDAARRIAAGSLPDVKFYPEEGKKLSVEDANKIIEDCAIRPVEGEEKLYVLTSFETASAVVQNKLLKSLEEPPQGVRFLLCATLPEPLLPTVRSRVKTLEITPFSHEQVFAYLQRKGANAQNARAAQDCGGMISVAEGILQGGTYAEIEQAALEIYKVNWGSIGELTAKYGEFKHKSELLGKLQTLALEGASGKQPELLRRWGAPSLLWAAEQLTRAAADVKFNAQFSALVYDFCLRLMKENEKWKKLSE